VVALKQQPKERIKAGKGEKGKHTMIATRNERERCKKWVKVKTRHLIIMMEVKPKYTVANFF
jgi:hypothetical protein